MAKNKDLLIFQQCGNSVSKVKSELEVSLKVSSS
jgi:hypothetical protein